MEIPGYNIIRKNHPSNTKRGGICVYYKNTLPFKLINIQEPTHILNLSSSCLDLIFTPQPNLVMESIVHSSLHPNCHHQVVFASTTLKINCFYKKAKPELI